MKRRLLKYVLVALGLLLLGSFWAFSFFFFNPFEEDYPYDLSTLIPREIDFYAAKADLADDFDPFPRLAVADEFLADPQGRAWLEYPWASGLLADLDIESLTAELDASLGQLPIDIDPLAVFGGREFAVAGFFSGPDPADWQWAVYGRANWMGKLAVELMRQGWGGLEAQGLNVLETEHGFQLSGGSLPRALHILRAEDVVVISTREDMVEQVREFMAKRGENSFGLSAQYANHLADLDLDGDELNVYVDQRKLLQGLGDTGAWPDPNAQDLVWAMLGRTIQLRVLRESMATLAFGNGLSLHLSGAFSSESMTAFQKSMYRERGFEKNNALEVARMVPDDAGMFLYGQGPLGDLLTELVDALDDSLLELLEDPVRDVWGYPDMQPLVADLNSAFGDRLGFFVRDNDYPEDSSADAPLHDDALVPAWAIILTVDSQEAVEGLRGQVGRSPSAFGIRGRDASKGGVFTNAVDGGGVVYEYHTIAIPGTGHLATLEMAGRGGVRYFLVSNSHRLLGHVFLTYNREERALSKNSWFETLVNTGLPSLDMLLWLNPRAVRGITRAMVTKDAAEDIALRIDWNVQRPRIEREVLEKHFPGERWGAVSAQNQSAFELRSSEAINAFEREFTQRELPTLRREYERPYDAAEIASAMLFELSLDPKGFELYGRVVVPFDAGGQN